MDVGQQQRSFNAPSACRDVGNGVIAAGICVPRDEAHRRSIPVPLICPLSFFIMTAMGAFYSRPPRLFGPAG
jgi:hypothetical protein